MLDIKQIEQIAQLARLELSKEEKQVYAKQISAVLDYVKMLEEVNTDGVEETCQVTGLEDVIREDVARNCDEEARQKLIAQFPEKIGDLLKVKKVFEN